MTPNRAEAERSARGRHAWATRPQSSAVLLGGMLLCAMSSMSQAADNARSARIEWSNAKEVLNYSSCGCADSCWTAELQQKQTHVLKARLRCDCETLFYYQPSAEPQRKVIGSCEAINANDDKSRAIRQQLEQLWSEPTNGGR